MVRVVEEPELEERITDEGSQLRLDLRLRAEFLGDVFSGIGQHEGHEFLSIDPATRGSTEVGMVVTKFFTDSARSNSRWVSSRWDSTRSLCSSANRRC